MKHCFTTRFLVILVTLISVVLLSAGIALAQNADPPTSPVVPALTDVLAMLASGVGVGAVIAFLFENIAWFKGLSPSAKWWTILLLSVGLPVLATVALQFIPPPVWILIQPYWNAVATGFLIWAGSQAFHLYSRSRG
jgi:hypothetical protein